MLYKWREPKERRIMKAAEFIQIPGYLWYLFYPSPLPCKYTLDVSFHAASSPINALVLYLTAFLRSNIEMSS